MCAQLSSINSETAMISNRVGKTWVCSDGLVWFELLLSILYRFRKEKIYHKQPNKGLMSWLDERNYFPSRHVLGTPQFVERNHSLNLIGCPQLCYTNKRPVLKSQTTSSTPPPLIKNNQTKWPNTIKNYIIYWKSSLKSAWEYEG